MTLTGTGFTNGIRAVRFGEVPVACPSQSCKVDSFGQLTVTSPPHPAGLVDVTVVTSGGVSARSRRFTFEPAPDGGGVVVRSWTRSLRDLRRRAPDHREPGAPSTNQPRWR